MTRLGGGILLLIVLLVGAFVAMTSFGPSPAAPARTGTSVAQEDRNLAPAGYLTVPVAGVARDAIQDNWGDPRGGGTRAHHGTDIMAPGGTPVLAAADGVVEKRFWSAGGGGNTLYVRSPDGRWTYYYAHLAGYAPGVEEGVRVRAGQPIAAVGDTGNAGPGNTHLHFGLSAMAPGDRWWQGRAVDPTPLLTGR